MSNKTQFYMLTMTSQKVERLTRELYQVATSIENEEAEIATTHPIVALDRSTHHINQLSRMISLLPEPRTNNEFELIAEIEAIQSYADLIVRLETSHSYTMTFHALWLCSKRALELVNLINKPILEAA